MNISIDTAELKPLLEQLKPSQIATVQTMALNRAVKKGKTEIKRAIQAVYTFPSSQIDHKDPDKGLSFSVATKDNLEAIVKVGHKPRDLSSVQTRFKSKTIGRKVSFKNGKTQKGKNIVRSVGQITVEAKKGEPKTFLSAFIAGRAMFKNKEGNSSMMATSAIFARGKREKGVGFIFSPKGDNRSYPIDSIKTLSLATAAQNVGVENTYAPIVEEFTAKEFERLIKNKIGI